MKPSEQFHALHQSAYELANRWVKAWPSNSGYPSAGNITYCFFTGKINFQANPSCSGIGLSCSIPASYMDDSNTLEEDSQKWYEAYVKDRDEKYQKMRELEESQAVKEYLSMKESQMFGSYLTHGAGRGIVSFIPHTD